MVTHCVSWSKAGVWHGLQEGQRSLVVSLLVWRAARVQPQGRGRDSGLGIRVQDEASAWSQLFRVARARLRTSELTLSPWLEGSLVQTRACCSWGSFPSILPGLGWDTGVITLPESRLAWGPRRSSMRHFSRSQPPETYWRASHKILKAASKFLRWACCEWSTQDAGPGPASHQRGRF